MVERSYSALTCAFLLGASILFASSMAAAQLCKNAEELQFNLPFEDFNQIVPDASGTNENPIPGVLNSAINVSGIIGKKVGTVRVYTDVKNTFVDDIGLTLVSPSGTEILLTINNLSANLFAGTLWSDYNFKAVRELSGTEALAGVAQPQLSPMQAFGLLRDEDPNGDWTLRVSDNLIDETTTLVEWRLLLEVCEPNPALETETISFQAQESFPFNEQNGRQRRELQVFPETTGQICGINIDVQVDHVQSGDLDIFLVAPDSSSIPLSTDNAETVNGAFANVSFSDDAPNSVYDIATVQTAVRPEHPLGAFYGLDPAGTWALEFEDDLDGDSGEFKGWAIDLKVCGEEVVISTPTPTPTPSPSASPSPSATPSPSPGISIFDRLQSLERAIRSLRPFNREASKKAKKRSRSSKRAARTAFDELFQAGFLATAAESRTIRKAFRTGSPKFRKNKRRALKQVRGFISDFS